MMTSATEKILAEYPLAWSAHDLDKLLTFFNDDCIYADPTLGVEKRGKDGILEFAKEIFSMQPDFHIEYSQSFATETHGAAIWTISNTWNGEFHGVDVTGTKVSFIGTTMFEFKMG
jgi:steroid delta-isomerase-like uncharacterized protein